MSDTEPGLIADLARENEWLRARVVRLEKALVAAQENLAHWGEYASDYFRQKWDLEGDLKAIEAALIDGSPDAT